MDVKKRTSVIASNEDTTNDIQVEVFNNFEALKSLRKQWDDFVGSVSSDIFMTYDWCRIWWKYYGKKRDLRVFIFRYCGKLVGIIPMFFERIWLGPISVRVVKIVGSDFTLSQFCLPLDESYIRLVIEKFYELVSSEHNWDIIHIGPIAGLYNHYDELRGALVESLGRSYCVSAKKKSVQTYFPLASSWEAQLAGLSKNARRNIKRNCKALNKALQSEQGNLISDLATIEDVNEVFGGFVRMHQQHWQKLGKLGHFGDWPDSFEFHKEMATTQLKHNRLRLMVSRWGRYCLGYEYAYKFSDRYFAFLNSRLESEKLDNINVGASIFAEQVKKALTENVRYIDAMQGKYEYKLRLGGKLFPVRSIYIFPKRLLVLIRVSLFRALARLLDLCYYRMWFCRIAPKLPLKRRSLWKIWIRTRSFA